MLSSRVGQPRKIPLRNTARKPDTNILVDGVEEENAQAATVQLSQKKQISKSKATESTPSKYSNTEAQKLSNQYFKMYLKNVNRLGTNIL